MTEPVSSRDGIPPGSLDYVLEALRGQRGPMKRRALLEELEQRGHRISLAGLNRIIEVGSREKRLSNGPDGVSIVPARKD